MVEATKKIISQYEELLELAVKESGFDLSDVSNMTENEFKCLKKAFEIMKAAKELVITQAEANEKLMKQVNEIDEKMNKLLKQRQKD